MDWLKDKKKQPIIAAAAAVVIVAVFIFVLRPMIFGGGSSSDTAAPAAPDMNAQQAPTMDPNMTPPETPTIPSATPTQPVQAAQASDKGNPMEPWRADPFLPIGYKAPKKQVVRKLPIADFPFLRIPLPPKIEQEEVYQEVQQPVRRMAGLLLNNRVYAIIETNGSSEIVQPGDTLKDRLAVVEKIEQDKVILKTTDKKPRYIIVRMAASPRTDIGAGANVPSESQSGGSGMSGQPSMMLGGRTRPPM